MSTADVQFAPTDTFQYHERGDWDGKSILQKEHDDRHNHNDRPALVAQRLREEDRLREKWEKDVMHTGRGFIGMEVRIAFAHQQKGLFGTVTGYHHTHNTPKRVKLGVHQHTGFKHGFDQWIMLTIKLEGSSQQLVEITLDKVVERL